MRMKPTQDQRMFHMKHLGMYFDVKAIVSRETSHNVL